MRHLIAATMSCLLLGAPALAHGRDPRLFRIPRASWFACDDVGGPDAVLFGPRDAKGTSAVTLLDRDTGRMTDERITVAGGDPGAGQVYYALSRSGTPIGTIHMVNPGMVGDPALPAVTGVDLDGRHLECRFMADMRFLGIARNRSVMVRGQGAGLVYESFDYRRRGPATHPDGVHRSNVPSLSIPRGTAEADGYRFANKGVVYRVDRVGVIARQDARTIAEDSFVAWEAAPIR